MQCIECGSEMYLDDVDVNFKGNKDLYWCCQNCRTSCIEEMRCFQRFRVLWHSENDDIVKDRVVKYRIDRCGR